MKILVGWAAALTLFTISGSVQAAGTYVLTDVGSWNTYTTKTPDPIPTLTGGPLGFAGTATVTAGGVFTATGVQFSFINANATFNYTNGSWSGVVGNNLASITHTQTCTESGGTPCTGAASGLAGAWRTGFDNANGADANNCYGANLVPGKIGPQCNTVAVIENPGVSTVVWESSAFAAPYTASGYRYTFSIVTPPVAVNDPATPGAYRRIAAQAGALNLAVLGNDTIPTNPVTLAISTPPAAGNGTAVVSGTNPGPAAGLSVNYTAPATTPPGFTGDKPITFQYRVTDNFAQQSAPATVTVILSNALPIARNDAAQTAQDVPVDVFVLDDSVNTPDTLGDAVPNNIVVTPTGPSAQGGIVGAPVNCSNAATPKACYIPFTPAAGYVGIDTFTYTLTDGNGDVSAPATVSVTTVSGPSAQNDSIRLNTATSLGFNPLTNDSGLAATPLKGLMLSVPGNGTATESTACVSAAACTVTYTPNPGFAGNDSFTYTVRDQNDVDSNLATVSVFVNDLPVAVQDIYDDVAVATPTSLDVQSNDTGLNDGPISISIVAQPDRNGSVSVVPGTPETILYTSDSGFLSGTEVFSYRLTDSEGLVNPGPGDESPPISVAVNINDVPVAVDDGAANAAFATIDVNTAAELDVLANDSGLNDTPLTVSVAGGSKGLPVVTGVVGGTAATIRIQYNANAMTGNDQFTYTIRDASGDESTATVYVGLTDPNMPAAMDDAASVAVNKDVTINVLANDDGLGNTPLLLTIDPLPNQGTATINADNTITYTPRAGASAGNTQTFGYYIMDDVGNVSNTATVTVSLTAASTPPEAEGGTDCPVSTVLNESVQIDVVDAGCVTLGNGTVDEHTFVVTQDPLHGTAAFGSPTVTYIPNSGFSGDDVFSYTVTDATGQTATGQIAVSVAGPPPAQSVGSSSAIGPLSLGALMGLLPWLRRRRSVR